MAIEINTAEQFMALRMQEDRGTASTPLDVVITQDLDFSNINDYQTMSTALNANIDGQDHKMKNITCVKDEGLSFIWIADGRISNLTFDNCYFHTNSWFDLVSLNGTTISALVENIRVNNNCYISTLSNNGKNITIMYTGTNAIVEVKNVMICGRYNSDNPHYFVYLANLSSAVHFKNFSVDAELVGDTDASFVRSASTVNTMYLTNWFFRVDGGGSITVFLGSTSSRRLNLYTSYGYVSLFNYSGISSGASGSIYGNNRNLLSEQGSFSSGSGMFTVVPTGTLKSAEEMRALGWVVSE